MFHFNEAGLVEVSEERVVIGDFRIQVRLDSDPQPQELAKAGVTRSEGKDQHGAYQEFLHLFQDEEQTIGVELKFRSYGRYALCWVNGEIRNANAFGKQTCFAADCGIVIQTGPIRQVDGLMANYQHKDWWTRPHFDTRMSTLPARTQSLLWRSSLPDYIHILPVCGPVIRTELCGGESDSLLFRLSSHQSGRTRNDTLCFVMGSGTDPYRIIEDHVEAAAKQLDGQFLPREQKKYPEILDYLGWCSWDAFYHQVNEEGLLTKAEEFRRSGLPVNWVMIDDGWSSVHDGKLSAFEADPVKFPRGLGAAVDDLKNRSGVRWVGVWHTVAGYWGGIDPASELAGQYAEYLRANVRGDLLPSPDGGQGFGFWHGWHSFLERQGVDLVKVDSQSAVTNFWRGQRSIGEAASAAHTALEASVALHFDHTMINCMGMAAENVWHRPKSAVSRNSDDFVPQERYGFAEHALQNAYNSYYHGAFYWGDWDMYWTKNHDDIQNAVLRSISGGPVYFSDAPGNTDPSRLWPLIYQDGKIIRCDRTPSPTGDCLFLDPTVQHVPLKLWNTAGEAGVIAAFHIGKYDTPVEGTVGPQDVPGLEGDRFALYEHFSRECLFLARDERHSFKLKAEEYALYTIIPVRHGDEDAEASGGIIPIGLAGKYISSHAVTDVFLDGKSTGIALREGGVFVFAAGKPPLEVYVQGSPRPFAKVGDFLYEVIAGEATGKVAVEIMHGR